MAQQSGRRRPTLKDVSSSAGVSIKTASRVVNGEENVSALLAARVRTAVAALGYEPNPLARGLRRGQGRTGAVAVVVDDIANPFSAAVHRAVADAVGAHGVVTLSASYDRNPDAERKAVLAFAGRRVDGVVLMPATAEHRWLDEIRDAGTQLVLVDRPVQDLHADVVMSDHRAAARRATTHLLRHGHHRVALLTDAAVLYTGAERVAGFEQALAAAGVPVRDRLVRECEPRADGAEQAVIDLLADDDPPTAMVTGQNLLTVGAVRGLRRLDLQHRIALVGLDDVELGDLLDPGVTVLAQSPDRIGADAAQHLLSRIAGDRSPAAVRLVPTRLVLRGSGEIHGPFRRMAAAPVHPGTDA